MLGPVNNGLVHTIKHDIHIRNPIRVPRKELQQTPNGEHGSALHTSPVQIHIQLPANNHHAKRRVLLGRLQMGRGDPGSGPRLQIVVDPSEEIGAFWGFRAGRRRTTPFRDVVVSVAAHEVGAVNELVGSVVEGLVGEGLGREEVPWRRVEVVARQCLRLSGEVVHLFDKMPKRIETEKQEQTMKTQKTTRRLKTL